MERTNRDYMIQIGKLEEGLFLSNDFCKHIGKEREQAG